LIPLFFMASLASRAFSVWSSGDARDVTAEERDGWLRRAIGLTVWIPVGMVAAVVLGLRSGLLDRLGSVLAPLGDAIASMVVFVFSQLARPIFWLVDRMGIDPAGVRRLFDRVGTTAGRARDRALHRVGQPSLLGRMLGLALFVGMTYGLIRLIRRLRPDTPSATTPPSSAHGAVVLVPGEPVGSDALPAHHRRELPADRVRRWYAEILLALARRGLPKEPALTPAEFAPIVARAYPQSAGSFLELTRAYQDVRYGDLRFDRATLHRLEGHRRSVLAVVRRSEPLPQATEEP
jgi:hypothetical protein